MSEGGDAWGPGGEEMSSASEAICPYCGYSYQVETEDFRGDGEAVEVKCSKCGLKYHLSQSYEVTHTSTPDCFLNGFPHKWEARRLPRGGEHDFCSRCDACRPVDPAAPP